jgi:hypothetical protein
MCYAFTTKVSIFYLFPLNLKLIDIELLDDLITGVTLKMKKFILSIISTTAFMATCGASAAWAQAVVSTAMPKAGIIKIIAGDVRARDAQGERSLKSGDAVFANDRLIAGKEGSASAVLRDGTTLVLTNNSQLDIQKFAFNATTHEGGLVVNLLQGSLRMLTGLIGKANPDAIQVKTKTLSVGIRGTDFIVETEDEI